MHTILFLDMVSYSRHMSEDEIATLDFMSSCFDAVRILTRKFDGTLLNTMGDGALILFDDSEMAAGFGIEFHRVIARMQVGAIEPKQFRIGIHAGPVVLRNGDAFGHHVNVAARCLTKARPGCTIVSETVFEKIAASPGYHIAALGETELKNMSARFVLYQLADQGAAAETGARGPDVSIHLIGPLTLQMRHGKRVTCDTPLMAALLAYLSLCPAHAEHVDRLAALLLPNAPRDEATEEIQRAFGSFRDSLAKPAQAAFISCAETLRLDLLHTETDIDRLIVSLRAGRVPQLLAATPDWPEMILPGLAGVSAVFDAWLQVMRDKACQRISDALEGLLRADRAASVEQREAADCLLLLEPGHELASECRIRERLAAGNRVSAFEEFDRLTSHLASRFKMRPNAKLQRLMAAAREDGNGGGLPRSRGGAPERPRRLLRIAVLPFEGASTDPSHMISGFRDELMANLARFRDWSIVTAPPDEPQSDVADAQIDYLLAGASHEDGGALDLHIKLTAAKNQRMIWSSHFQLDTASWAIAQRQVIAQIAASLEVYISTDRLAAKLGSDRVPKTTQDQWLAGDRAAVRWSREAAEEAERIFRQIIAADPDHAPSYASLANLSNVQHITSPGLARTPQQARQADRLAIRAVELDPMDARNQRALAWSAALSGAHVRATLHFDLALELNPNSPETLASCAMGLAWMGEKDKAQSLVTQLLEITQHLPGWLWCYVASVYFFLGRYEDALKAAELSGDAIVDNQAWVAASLAMLGETERAGQAFRLLIDEVTPLWEGEAMPDAASVLDWAQQAYPIRIPEDRACFADALKTAMQAA